MRDDRHRWRKFFPAKGACYELYDTSIFLFGFALVGYVLTKPPSAVSDALAAPLQIVTERQLGYVLLAASIVGIVCAYLPDYLALGYLCPRIAAAFLTLNFLVTLVTLAVNQIACLLGHEFLPADVDTIAVARSAFLYALIFGWATRRLSRDYDE